ncbi:hypothetical protein HMPREF9333_00409 [Johnsonella ignava ATCC 51276]|uniref:Putative amidase domain-containing protein n=2 Tax=Johnsonella TaxID=43994 RepID=G5GFS0_9FIRM|nr:hypothetical protein HMPREF9333_00409 [Johnsonella ignava ATCC 51276]
MNTFAAEIDEETWQGVSGYVNEVYPNLSEEDKQQLIKELYEERMNSANQITAIPQDEEQLDRVDESYDDMMKEENYIVNLINNQGENTSLDNWEFNLHYLKEHHDELSNKSNINMEYVDSYIQAYNIVQECEKLPKSKVNTTTVLTNSYNHEQAVNYANKWWNGHNPNYSNWDGHGGDCANFVSQCLHAGGKPMNGTDRNSASSWFSRTNKRDTSKLSDTWIDAGMFRWYWQDHASSYKDFSRGGEETYNYTWPGDAISFVNNNGRAYHTLICNGYDKNSKKTYMASHSYASNNRVLNDRDSRVIVYNMR